MCVSATGGHQFTIVSTFTMCEGITAACGKEKEERGYLRSGKERNIPKCCNNEGREAAKKRKDRKNYTGSENTPHIN
eukprot:1162014-Pelagomonas_calceolata.AAC.13